MVLLSLRRSVKFTTSWSVPVEVGRDNWLCKRGLIIVPFKPRTTGYVGKAENEGSKAELSSRHTRKNVGTYQVLKYREEGSELGRESRSRTVYELLFGRLCADANGISEEVSLVPAGLGDGLRIEERATQATMDLLIEPYIPG